MSLPGFRIFCLNGAYTYFVHADFVKIFNRKVHLTGNNRLKIFLVSSLSIFLKEYQVRVLKQTINKLRSSGKDRLA